MTCIPTKINELPGCTCRRRWHHVLRFCSLPRAAARFQPPCLGILICLVLTLTVTSLNGLRYCTHYFGFPWDFRAFSTPLTHLRSNDDRSDEGERSSCRLTRTNIILQHVHLASNPGMDIGVRLIMAKRFQLRQLTTRRRSDIV